MTSRGAFILAAILLVLPAAGAAEESSRVTLDSAAAPPPISADEPLAGELSLERAARYLDHASLHWQKEKKCGTCHTNFAYLMARPALASVSPPAPEVRAFFEEMVEKRWETAGPRWDAEVVVAAATLAFNDRLTGKGLHPSTRKALDRMAGLQRADGGWDWPGAYFSSSREPRRAEERAVQGARRRAYKWNNMSTTSNAAMRSSSVRPSGLLAAGGRLLCRSASTILSACIAVGLASRIRPPGASNAATRATEIGSLCGWPPMESDDHFGAAFAAVGIGVAPGDWAGSEMGKKCLDGIRRYLGKNPPPSLHHRAMVLWASLRVDGILDDDGKKRALDDLLALQLADGGWAVAGLLAGWKEHRRLDDKPQDTTTSDGYATGLAVYLARQAGIPASDERLRRGIRWLKANQRESGRWFTRSPTKDSRHYLSNYGTAFSVMALAACGEVP